MHVAKRILILAVALTPAIQIVATPAHAQFEEPDTVGAFAIGPFVELFFRGDRGEITILAGQPPTRVSLSGGPAVGLRMEYRLTRTFTLGATASYSKPDEKQELAGSPTISAEGITQFQFTGEAHLRVKPNIPGYFILGGGVRRGDPDAGALHRRTFTEPLAILGAGLQFASRRRLAGRLELRGNFVSPANQPQMDMENVVIDFSIGLGLILRP